MEASIIFHFAGRGVASSRLALVEFAQLLDPKWRAPHDEEIPVTSESFVQSALHSAYSFVQGGMSLEVSALHAITINTRHCGSIRCHNSIPHRSR